MKNRILVVLAIFISSVGFSFGSTLNEKDAKELLQLVLP